MRRVALSCLVLAGLAAVASCNRFGTGSDPADDPKDAAVPTDALAPAPDGDTDDDGGEIDGLPDAGPVSCDAPSCVPGGDCIGGQCSEIFITEPLDRPIGVAVSKSLVYVTLYNGSLGRKLKVATDRGQADRIFLDAAPVSGWSYLSRANNTLTWARNLSSVPNVIAVDIGAANLVTFPQSIDNALSSVSYQGTTYVSAYSEGKVYKLGDNGGLVPQMSWPAAQVEGLASDGFTMWAARWNQGVVSRVLPQPAVDLPVNGNPAGIDVNQGYIYGTDQNDGSIFRIAVTGGQPRETLARVPGTAPHGISVDSTNIYWTAQDQANTKHWVLRIRKPE